MSETYIYGRLEHKRAKDGRWEFRTKGKSMWYPVISPAKMDMLDALHPELPVQVTLDGIGTFWLTRTLQELHVWRREIDNSDVGTALAAALDRIVELGGAD